MTNNPTYTDELVESLEELESFSNITETYCNCGRVHPTNETDLPLIVDRLKKALSAIPLPTQGINWRKYPDEKAEDKKTIIVSFAGDCKKLHICTGSFGKDSEYYWCYESDLTAILPRTPKEIV